MLRVCDINQPVVTVPAVAMDDGVGQDSTADGGKKCTLLSIRRDLGVYAAVALEDAETTVLLVARRQRAQAKTLRPRPRTILCFSFAYFSFKFVLLDDFGFYS